MDDITKRVSLINESINDKFRRQIKLIATKKAPLINIKDYNKGPVLIKGSLDLNILKEEGFYFVKKIYLDGGGITSIENIPNTVESLVCINNELKSISSLPVGIKELNLENNKLKDIDLTQTSNLVVLNISHNEIQELDHLPSTLKELNCSFNQLRRLDLYGLKHLNKLYINNNNLITVINIPISLKIIKYYNNPLKEIQQLDTINDLVIYDYNGNIVNNNNIYNVSNNMAVSDEQYSIDDKNIPETTPTEYKEAIYNYFKLKKEYEAELKKSRLNIIKKNDNKKKKYLLESLKGKCVVCKRNVGTIFKKNNNNYIALCGDVKNPCRLNIKIFNGTVYNFFDDMHYFKEHVEKNIQNIIKQKMDVLFGYVSEQYSSDIYDKTLEIYNNDNANYMYLFEIYKDIYDNPNKKELFRLKMEKIYEIMYRIDEKMIEYKKNHTNKELLSEAIDIHINELKPEIIELRKIKYEIMNVVCNEDVCKLVQNEHNIDKFINILEDPKIIRYIT